MINRHSDSTDGCALSDTYFLLFSKDYTDSSDFQLTKRPPILPNRHKTPDDKPVPDIENTAYHLRQNPVKAPYL